MRDPFKKALPWLILCLAAPALFLVNGLFLLLFPAPGKDPAEAFFSHASPLIQAAHIYDSKAPSHIAGDFYFTLGTQLAARGQLIAAERLLADAAKLLPDNASAQLNHGVVLEALDKFEPAMAAYQAAVKADPKMVEGHYNLGLLYDKTGNTEKGIEELQEALKLEPMSPFISYDLGVLYAKRDDYANSAKYSGIAVEGNKDFAEAHNNYAYALAHLGRHEEALKAAETSLKLKPDSAATLDTKGYILFGMGKYEEATAEYDKAIKLDPTIGEIHLHKAQALEKLNRFKESATTYETYLQLTPQATDRALVEAKINELKKWQDQTRKDTPKPNGPAGS